ncbi:MAG: TIGR04282 family arsenosugar biosynthesis glycosyltransferase [Elusimicrobiota bacterium]
MLKFKSCINVFAKFPRAGKVKTRLAPKVGSKMAAELYRNFVLDIIEVIDKVEAEVNIYCHPEGSIKYFKRWLGDYYKYLPQQGGDLGKRMKNSLKSCFEKGYQKTVIIGSDSPDMPCSYIKEAIEELDDNDTVIGPSDDGGYYLIGFTESGFTGKAFEGINWGTDTVFNCTMDTLQKCHKKVKVLREWTDIDNYKDLKNLYKRCNATECVNTKKFIEKKMDLSK